MSVHRIRIPELVIPGMRLGRHIHIDDRNAAYPAELAPQITSVKHQSAGLPLDQGQIGSCTANALCGALNSVPHWAPGQGTLTETNAVALYGRETADEGSPYPPNDPGGSGLAVCQAAKEMGLLDGYQHATGIDQALAALVIRPVITGINWFSSFDSPAPPTSYIPGLVQITPGATVRGGHEILADEIDAASELVWLWNSWGPSWGVGGRFCMTFATWEQLLQQGGDVTVPRTAKGWHA
ncbi:MAG TPA: hypothetical protein VG275_07090 [Solirubrobacteraceae bacterium]|jgi:hypothetical protein|nr:hypothetical protein [Solirubrobacteraceae bacterium]